MLVLLTEVKSKVKATVAAGSAKIVNAAYKSKATLTSAVYKSRLKLEYVTGSFFSKFLQLFTDTTEVNDSSRNTVSKQQRENLQLSEIVAKTIRPTLRETNSVTDSISKEQTKRPIESSSIVDQIFISTQFNRSVQDNLTIQDSIVPIRERLRNVFDTATLTDDYLGITNIDDDQSASLNKNLLLTTSLSDIVTRTAQFNRTEIDFSNSIDSSTNTVSKNLLPDKSNITDTVVRQIQRPQLDSSTLLDGYSISFNIENIKDTYSISELTSKTLAISSGIQLLTISENFSVVLSNYFSDNYVETDYSGTQIISQTG